MNLSKEQTDRLKAKGITPVAIVETDVYGCKAYHFRCLICGEEGKRQDRNAAAVRQAKAHRCKESGR